MNYLSNIKKNSQLIFFCMCICYLPFANIIKSILVVLDISIGISPFIILRIMFFLTCLYIFLTTKKKFNSLNFLIFLIFLLFLLNILFNNTPELIKFLNINNIGHGYSLELQTKFFNNKNKDIYLLVFNILPVIIIFSFCKFNFEINKTKKYLIHLQEIILIFILLFYFFYIYNNFIFNKEYFLSNLFSFRAISFLIVDESKVANSHLISFTLISHFALILDKYYKNHSCCLFFYKVLYLTLIALLFALKIFFITSILLLIFIFIKKKLNKYLLSFFLIMFPVVIFLIFGNIKIFFTNEELYNISQSIFWRSIISEFYLNNFSSFNFISGNSIYDKNIFSYSHNFLYDIYFSSGILGVSIITYFLFKSFKIKSVDKYVVYLNFSLMIFSSFAGYFFYNNFFIVSLMLLNSCLLKNDKNI